jgi:uncharacterized cofD-like protein
MGPIETKSPKVVVIGGGTGSFTLLSSLKDYTQNITALVNMADDGGSTGQLRDELGVLPPGDVRQCLVALSRSPRVRDLFDYRFDQGSFRGHAFGNLFLTALEKMTGDFGAATELAGEVLNIVGRVEPITHDKVTLVMESSDGKVTEGEFHIGDADFGKYTHPIIRLKPQATINPDAKTAIEEADIVVIAPGNLYGSIAPALVVGGVADAIKATAAQKVYVCNLVTKPGQTDGFTVGEYAAEIERFLDGAKLDIVLYNSKKPSDDLISRYAHDGEFPVEWDEAKLAAAHYDARGMSLVAGEIWQDKNSANDPIANTRTLIRHDSDAVARELMRIYFA